MRRPLHPIAVWSLAILLTTVPILAGCGSSADPPPATVRVSETDAGRTIDLRPGERLVLTLESNVTTGFRWVVTRPPNADVLTALGSDYVEPTTTLLGAGGAEVWRFRAEGEGTTGFELTYQRSSDETSGTPFALDVRVSAA
jgi:inhibitor of cysteine peptidase